jgi:uncharacterized protein involved in exopolysaccharide biosynthesis
MKRSVKLASRFYPAAWRKRYATEFEAMLDQVDADWKDVFDILKGALTMQFSSWNFKTILLTFGLAGAVIGAVVAFSIPNRYSYTSVVRITSRPENSVNYVMAMRDRLTGTMKGVITNGRLNGRLLSYKPGPDTVLTFAIQTENSDPKTAQAVNGEVVSKLTSSITRGEALTSVQVAELPNRRQQSLYPARALIVFAGLFAGLLIGLTVSFALRWRIVIVRRPAH